MKLKRVLEFARRQKLLSDLIALRGLWGKTSYLQQIGWFDSTFQRMPVDEAQRPIPWFTYPAIDFLEKRVTKKMSVFEYGSGNSTLWWHARISTLVSCEHDGKWYESFKKQLPNEISYQHLELSSGGYSKAILNWNDHFDIIVIDGRERVKCAKSSLQALKPDGVIIWDNSDRIEYQEGFDYLLKAEFKRLDFTGFGPIINTGWCTSVFYRSENCLAI